MKYVQWYALTYLWCGEGKQDEIYTYGSRLREPVDQVEEAIKNCVKEQRDRQVTMVVRLPEDIYKINPKTKERHEPPCLSLIDTEILDGKMHLTCYFRSAGTPSQAYPPTSRALQLFNEAFVAEINERANLRLANWQTDLSLQRTATFTSGSSSSSRNCWRPKNQAKSEWQWGWLEAPDEE
jgi:hypothetical protein